MSGYNVSDAAQDDLDDILLYVLEASGSRAASRLLDEFAEGFAAIAARPGIGHWHADVCRERQEIRCWSVHSFLIFYWPDTRPIVISRVLHGARDLSSVIFGA